MEQEPKKSFSTGEGGISFESSPITDFDEALRMLSAIYHEDPHVESGIVSDEISEPYIVAERVEGYPDRAKETRYYHLDPQIFELMKEKGYVKQRASGLWHITKEGEDEARHLFSQEKSWNNLSPALCKAVFDIFRVIEKYAKIALPGGKSGKDLYDATAAGLLDYAEREGLNEDWWKTVPESFDVEGQKIYRDELRKDLTKLILDAK